MVGRMDGWMDEAKCSMVLYLSLGGGSLDTINNPSFSYVIIWNTCRTHIT